MERILSTLSSHEFLAAVLAAVVALVGLLHIGVFLLGEISDAYRKAKQILFGPRVDNSGS